MMDTWKQPAVRVRTTSGGVDQYGEPVPGETVEEPLPDCLFAPGGTSEPVSAGAAPVVSQPTAYWPGEWPDLQPADRVRVGGVLYRVEGRPAAWPRGLVATLASVDTAVEEHPWGA
ncbi:hypothetical protein [Actinomyces sp. MRS3W]|uniref:hypothetical protein n=1 Tax=Actinomyces sp. MRS3W TaxID=2800796 RepID=UPI0028FD0B94|nr:hypothetical protein [Actinomyces sp. MRS3W]MDU0349235.1 hypothetical protein [Actinomyces sp. MRS3W]